jgi:uncharacterized C2H2 Zn-finger protein
MLTHASPANTHLRASRQPRLAISPFDAFLFSFAGPRCAALFLCGTHDYSGSVSESEGSMANREQRGNKEKKKPKQDKDKKEKAPVTAFMQPELVRKPHKGKQQT